MVPESDFDNVGHSEPPVVCIRARGSELNAKEHDVLLVESIEQTLGDLLGRRAREAIYDYLERQCYMSRDEIPARLGEFCSILQSNFGKGGHTIQKTIAKRFYSKLEKPFVDIPGYTLTDYVQRAANHSDLSIDVHDVPMTTTSVTTSVFCGSGDPV